MERAEIDKKRGVTKRIIKNMFISYINVNAFLTLTSSGSHESNVRDRTFEKWTPKLLQTQNPIQMHVRMICYIVVCVCICVLPVYARAGNAQCDAQINRGPVGSRLPAVTALSVPWDSLHLLQGLPTRRFLLPWTQTHTSRRHWATAISLLNAHKITFLQILLDSTHLYSWNAL